MLLGTKEHRVYGHSPLMEGAAGIHRCAVLSVYTVEPRIWRKIPSLSYLPYFLVESVLLQLFLQIKMLHNYQPLPLNVDEIASSI